jgi:hypothetical protein
MMDEKKIVGFTLNEEYAKWAYQETHPDRISHKP